MIIWQPKPTTFLGLSTDQWSAIASLATTLAFLAAVAVGVVAFIQLTDGRRARLDQNRPYLVISFRGGVQSHQFVDIVLENIGRGAARNVRITVDPPLERATEVPEYPIMKARFFTEAIPMVAPGQLTRMFFDGAVDRADHPELPDSYAFTLDYDDGYGHHFTEVVVDDLSIRNGLLLTQEYTMHHAADALRSIEGLMKSSTLFGRSDFEVVTEERGVRRERRKTEHEERAKRHEALVKRMKPEADGDDKIDGP